ncbi:MAG: PAS domain S-box protein [Rhodocyclales bacterium]|nr:PAS domain S-box protein [Rhodocyclales bacterium]
MPSADNARTDTSGEIARSGKHGLLVQASDLGTMRAAPILVDWHRQPTTQSADARPAAAPTEPGAQPDVARLIDFSLLNDIFDNFLEVTGLPIAVIDLDGRVLASSKWQRLCLEFHRANAATLAGCLRSDTLLSRQLQDGTDCAIYCCANGLTDCATPIDIDGIHVANLFTGQFLLSAPDIDSFKRRQAACGFDEIDYFKALAEVPIVVEQKIPAILRLLRSLAQQIARRSLAEKRALSALADVEVQVAERTQTLRESEDRFRTLFENASVGQLLVDPDSLRILECNQAAATIHGYSREELCRLSVPDFDVALDAEALRALQARLRSEDQLQFETRVRRKNGELRDLSVKLVVLRAAAGNRIHATHLDVTEQRRAEREQRRLYRALRLLSDCNMALLQARDEATLLADVCRLVVETGGYAMAWIGFAENDAAQSVRAVAQFGDETGYLEAIRVSWNESDESGRGPTGTAIRTGAAQTRQHFPATPTAPWYAAAVRSGFRSNIALPLIVHQKTLGALTLYAAEPDAFNTEEIALLDELVRNLAFGIATLRARSRRKDAEIELKLERDRNQMYLDIVQTFMVALDTAGRITMINRAGYELLDYEESELLGRNWFATCLPQPTGSAKVLPAFRRIMTGESPPIKSHEQAVCCRDGAQRLIAWRNAYITDAAGAIVGVLSSGQDVTERRQAEEQLRKLAQVVEQSPHGVIVANLDGDMEYVNEAFVQTTGYRRDEVIGQNPRILRSGKTPPESYVQLWDALTQGRTWHGELYNRRKDGSEYVERAAITPIRQADGRISHYVAVKEDITEHKRTAAELEQHRHHLEELVETRTHELAQAKIAAEAASAAKSGFLANMSHEIRTPLHVIIGLGHLLRHDVADAVQLERLNHLCASSDHLLAIINDVLDLSKIEAQRLALDRSDFRLGSVVDKVLRMIEGRAHEKGLTLTLDVAPRLRRMALNGDALRLAQVLINLCGNAVKFSDQGEVHLGIELLAEDAVSVALRFSVADTGIGISLADQARIFQPFAQGDASPTRRHDGTGLGLAICQRLVGLMGGAIQVDSQLGSGSTFCFELALSRASATLPEAAPLPVAPAATVFNGRHVLFAEDHALSQEILLEMLEDLGCDSDVAADGAEAVACAQARSYDLILMDMQMPKMDGLAATRAIRALPAHRATPIIALTANAFAEDRQRCLDAGMNGHLGKPLTPAALAATLGQWLPDLVASSPEAPACANELSRMLTSVPELDVVETWLRSRERFAEYCTQLDRFVMQHGDDMARLRAHLAVGDVEAAHVVVHQLKGIAGLIGARRVMSLASKIVHELRAGADAATIEFLAGDCETEFAKLATVARKLAGAAAGA